MSTPANDTRDIYAVLVKKVLQPERAENSCHNCYLRWLVKVKRGKVQMDYWLDLRQTGPDLHSMFCGVLSTLAKESGDAYR